MTILCDPSYRVGNSPSSSTIQKKQTEAIRAIYERNEGNLATLISSKKPMSPFHPETFWN